MTRTPSIRTPAPNTQAASALARAVDPVSVDEFRERYWEKRPLHLARDGAARFDDLLSEADVERLIESGIRHPAFRLVKAGERLSQRDYTVDIPWRPSGFSGTADVERVAAAFADGATIVVQALHHWWRPLAVFTRSLEAELGHPGQTNAYWTPRDSQGLPIHHDTHDVFVLQVAGEKRWLVYEPVWELPLKEQRYTASMGTAGEPILDVTLRPGDTLYLPRGWLHEAVTSASDSLHLTVGANVYTWVDAFRAAVAAAEDDVGFRRSVPADGEGAAELLEALASRLAPDAVARRMRRRFVGTRRPILAGHVAQVRALERLDVETPVVRRSTVVADVGPQGDGVALAFEGKTLVFPAHARDEVEWIARADRPFTPAELPGRLDADGRLVLVRRLVREGYLALAEVSERGPAPSSRSDGASPRSAPST